MSTTTAPPTPLSLPSRPTYSCVRCSDRKVKCDRQKPCGACVKHHVECVFNLWRPPPKRHKRAKDQILADRLKQYEALLQQQGIDPTKLPEAPASETRLPEDSRRLSQNADVPAGATESQLRTPSSIDESDLGQDVSKTLLVHGQGRSKFVDK